MDFIFPGIYIRLHGFRRYVLAISPPGNRVDIGHDNATVFHRSASSRDIHYRLAINECRARVQWIACKHDSFLPNAVSMVFKQSATNNGYFKSVYILEYVCSSVIKRAIKIPFVVNARIVAVFPKRS